MNRISLGPPKNDRSFARKNLDRLTDRVPLRILKRSSIVAIVRATAIMPRVSGVIS